MNDYSEETLKKLILRLKIHFNVCVFVRLLGKLVISLQHVVTAGRLLLREPLTDSNYSLTDVRFIFSTVWFFFSFIYQSKSFIYLKFLLISIVFSFLFLGEIFCLFCIYMFVCNTGEKLNSVL